MQKLRIGLLGVLWLALTFSAFSQVKPTVGEPVQVMSMLDVHEMKVVREKVLPPLISETRRAWLAALPPEAGAGSHLAVVVIEFFLTDAGKVRSMKICNPVERKPWIAPHGRRSGRLAMLLCPTLLPWMVYCSAFAFPTTSGQLVPDEVRSGAESHPGLSRTRAVS